MYSFYLFYSSSIYYTTFHGLQKKSKKQQKVTIFFIFIGCKNIVDEKRFIICRKKVQRISDQFRLSFTT